MGCGPTTAKSLNNLYNLYKLLNSSNVPEQAKNGIMGAGKNPQRNLTYNWKITAGEYNGYVKEHKNKPKQNNNVTKFPAPEQKDDQQIAAAWWEKPAGNRIDYNLYCCNSGSCC